MVCVSKRESPIVVPLSVRIAWPLLGVLSIGAALIITRSALPAAWLVGPMTASIVLAASGTVDLHVPRPLFVASQAIIGCLIAQAVEPQIVASIAANWLPMIGAVVMTIAAATITGWTLARFGTLPAATAAWGSTPGAAAAMTVMSAEYGADPRLVGFMQYVRVIIVVMTAAFVSRLLLGSAHGAPPAGVRDAAITLVPFLETIGVAVAGAGLGLALRVPSGQLLGPMVLGGALHIAGIVNIELPRWLLDATYATVGAYVGLGFTLETVRYAVRALPQMMLGTALLIALCAGSARLLAATANVDPLSAYLATSPGGMDSVAIIALGSGVNVPLVLSLQALRVFVVILTGPSIAKFIARTAAVQSSPSA